MEVDVAGHPPATRRRRFRGLRACLLALVALAAAPSLAQAAPPSVTAYYVYGTSLSSVQNAAYNDGCYFASHQPGGFRVLLFDFGAARATSAGGGSIDFSNWYISNPDIQLALESASNGVHNCYTQGTTDIVYGNSNYEMTQAGMTTTDATDAGTWQAQRADNVFNYEQNNGRTSQSADAGVDMEPSYDVRPISNDLVNGANNADLVIDYDYGAADGCPSAGTGGGCNNGWTTFDVGWASFSGLAEPLPEIYYGVNAQQWAVIRYNWDNSGGGRGNYFFAGNTSENSSGTLSPAQGWNDLSADNPGIVDGQPGNVCFGC
jgi:hypothetical protein